MAEGLGVMAMVGECFWRFFAGLGSFTDLIVVQSETYYVFLALRLEAMMLQIT